MVGLLFTPNVTLRPESSALAVTTLFGISLDVVYKRPASSHAVMRSQPFEVAICSRMILIVWY